MAKANQLSALTDVCFQGQSGRDSDIQKRPQMAVDGAYQIRRTVLTRWNRSGEARVVGL